MSVAAPRYLLLIASLLVSAPALPQPLAPAPTPSAPSPLDPAVRLSTAKELFRRGVELFNAGDWEGALEFFMRSRAFVPSNQNTTNAAICLERLGRFDEALEMYEELLRAFGGELSPAEQASVGQLVRALGQKVGSLQITANVDGQVIVNHHNRGRLPLVGPIRVLKTRLVVRIVKEGYIPFEMVVDVAPGAFLPINARLRLLTGVGLLRVEDSGSEGADVFVDGRRVGAAPWEGVVDPGKHLVWTQRGNRGSAPAAIVAVQGQTALARMASSALGPEVHIDASPAEAEISVDGTALRIGAWKGRLPVGLHEVAASAKGYKRASKPLMVPPSGSEEPRVHLALAVDPTYKPPPPPPPPPSLLTGRAFIGGFGGYAWSPTLHVTLVPVCKGACNPVAMGALGGVRGGYRLGFGLAPEVAGGYMAVGSSLSSLRGLFFGLGISYRVAPVRWLGILVRATAGLLGAQTGQGKAVVPSNPTFVMPEIGAEAAFGGLRTGIGIGIGIFPTIAPDVDVPAGKLTPYGRFLLVVPQAAVGYSFQ